jgi:hypothetical protein
MKSAKWITAAMAFLLLPAAALADAPTIEITEPAPGQIVYVEEFPAIIPVTFTITHDDTQGGKTGLTLLNVLDVLVDDVSVLPGGEIGNPFQQGSTDNVCSDNVDVAFSACAVNESGTAATLTYDWIVDGVGTYPLTITSRHTGQGVETEEQDIEVALSLVDVEYKAPPAVANEILKSSYAKAKGGVHGCIISSIANKHAQSSAYGPKGGPYDEDMIAEDVAYYFTTCQSRK